MADEFSFGHAFVAWLQQYCRKSRLSYEKTVRSVTDFGRELGYPATIVQWDDDQCLAGRDYLVRSGAGGQIDRPVPPPGVPTIELDPSLSDPEPLDPSRLRAWIDRVCGERGMRPDAVMVGVNEYARNNGFPAAFDDWSNDQCELARMTVFLALRRMQREGQFDRPAPEPVTPERLVQREGRSGRTSSDERVAPVQPSYGDRLLAWVEAHDPRLVDRDLMRIKLEQWGQRRQWTHVISLWDKAMARAGWEYLDSGVNAGMFTPESLPVGNIHDADPDAEAAESEPEPEPDEPAEPESRVPALPRAPEPPKAGRVYGWLKKQEEDSGVSIAVPWRHQVRTAYRDEIAADRKLNDYTDRERDLLYRFALWCLGFAAAAPATDPGPSPPRGQMGRASEPAPVADPEPKARTAAEWRCELLDLGERLILARSAAGHGPDEEPLKVVPKGYLDALFLKTAHDAIIRLRRPTDGTTPPFNVTTCTDWPLMARMVDILRQTVASWEAELAKAKEDRARAKAEATVAAGAAARAAAAKNAKRGKKTDA